MSKTSDRVKSWRHKTKALMIESFGGGCCICGYSKCHASLDFHHIDPSEKDFGLGSIMANPRKWEFIVGELRKCVLLCRNCHGEIHAGISSIPELAPRFNETYATKVIVEENLTSCPVCGKLKSAGQITCSYACSHKRKGIIKWDSIDLEDLLRTNTYIAIADMLGCSDGAVIKRAKKLGLYVRKLKQRTKSKT